MNTKKIIVGVVAIIALLFFGVIFLKATYYSPSDEIPLSFSMMEDLSVKKSEASTIKMTDTKAEPVYPVSLSIPKLKIDAKIQKVGITKRGNMAPPNNFTDVGWYKYGAMPGEVGSAVIAGHFNNGLSFPAVFYNLKNLKIGDDIYVTMSGDKKLHFVVIGSETFDFNASVAKLFTEKKEKLLRLITCTGSWMVEYKTHNKRLVVSAKLVL